MKTLLFFYKSKIDTISGGVEKYAIETGFDLKNNYEFHVDYAYWDNEKKKIIFNPNISSSNQLIYYDYIINLSGIDYKFCYITSSKLLKFSKNILAHIHMDPNLSLFNRLRKIDQLLNTNLFASRYYLYNLYSFLFGRIRSLYFLRYKKIIALSKLMSNRISPLHIISNKYVYLFNPISISSNNQIVNISEKNKIEVVWAARNTDQKRLDLLYELATETLAFVILLFTQIKAIILTHQILMT